jgi:hypothetical protein
MLHIFSLCLKCQIIQASKFDMIYLFNCNWVVTRWQCTFTHKQYIEQHKEQPNKTNNNESGRVRAVPRLC